MESFCITAILVSRTDFGESDRIVGLLTPERGKITAFARGARKSRRRFAGVLEPCSLIQATVCTSRGSMLTLEDAALLDGFDALRRDLAAISRAAYACELAKNLCAENASSREIFELLLAFLRGQADAEDLMCFELGVLGAAGFRPGLNRCAVCGAQDTDGLRFAPELGGRLCPRCARTRGARISPETLGILAAFQAGHPEAGRDAPSWIRSEARKTLTGYVVHHMGHRLKSYDFMQCIGLEA